MKWSWIFPLLFISHPAAGLEPQKPIHSCVSQAYAIRIFNAEPAGQRIEIRGANLRLINRHARFLIPNHDKLHFPIGKPHYECASISPDGSDYLETIRVYDGFVQILKATPGTFYSPLQYELD
jgi:hypothetical protein